MAVRTRLKPLEKDVLFQLAPELSPKGRSEAHAAFARQALAEAQETNRQVLGRVPSHETYVDGRRDAPLESVNPDRGRILFEFELHEEMFSWIDEMLRKHSPVGKDTDQRPGHPGLYRASHLFLADGDIVEEGSVAPAAHEYAFVNSVPYSRKIERGLSSQAPTGVYQAVAGMAARRFGNLARIRFSYITVIVGGIHEWSLTTKRSSPKQSARNRADWLRRQPAILITLR